MTDKFKSACVEYEKQRAAIVSISKDLQHKRAECWAAQGFGDPFSENSNYIDHLAMAYEMEYTPSDSGYGDEKTFVHHDDDVVGYLEEACPHCLAAHYLVQERKAAKKLFGIAKRRISALVRAA
jgi:hypothetical protein